MLKQAFATIMLSAFGVSSVSAETLTFQYTGFYDAYNGFFLPDLVLKGIVTGYDANHDGALTKNEVQRFRFGDLDVDSNQYGSIDTGDELCGRGDYSSWCLQSFSYSAAGGLQFKAYSDYGDEEFSNYTSVVSGDYFTHSQSWAEATYLRWTPETRFEHSMSPLPVPEPATYAMLGLGFAVLAARRRVG